jgi:hypothetical protein
VNVQTKEYVALFVEEKKLCTMFVYCCRPQALLNLKYNELFEKFIVRREVPIMCGVVHGVDVCGRDQQRRYFRIDSVDDSFGKPVYLVERDAAQRSLCRLAMVSMFAGERWYLRLVTVN